MAVLHRPNFCMPVFATIYISLGEPVTLHLSHTQCLSEPVYTYRESPGIAFECHFHVIPALVLCNDRVAGITLHDLQVMHRAKPHKFLCLLYNVLLFWG